MKRIIILGCTGSIGESSLDIARRYPELFEVVGVSAHQNSEKLVSIVKEFNIPKAALSGISRDKGNGEVDYWGEEGLLNLIEETEADIVINGIAGAKGLMPSVVSLRSGKDLALANKETMVMAGEIINEIAREHGKTIIPVDSEHSALFFLMRNQDKAEISEVILTASGGAFRDHTYEELEKVTLEDALKHPTWDMGTKITIDSASMANKGLEVIEAQKLFNLAPEQIKVLIHRQSYVHSMTRTIDGCLYAQISKPDMRQPIQHALFWPEIHATDVNFLDLAGKTLTFEAPDMKKFKMLELAYRVCNLQGVFPVLYNAANEVAVDLFVKKKISFLGIPDIVERVINESWDNKIEDLDHVFEIDNLARKRALNYV